MKKQTEFWTRRQDWKRLRRVSMLITAQSAYNLELLRAMCGYREIGEVVDKLVREKMRSLHVERSRVNHLHRKET